MKIVIETIPHDQQRYSTCGDWFFRKDIEPSPDGKMAKVKEVLHINVSQLSDWRREALIAVHELVEVLLCDSAGVTQAQVDEFDKEYEKNRPADDVESEPGDDPKAPYCRQHCFATAVERMMAAEMGVNWNEYADEIESLP
jgi:hypothetical protein